MANMISILDTIRANASLEYQTRVPLAEQSTIEQVGNPLTTYATLQNEFLTLLIGRIALSVIKNKTAKNPLAPLKKGSIPLGSDIQEIFTNMAEDTGFDPDGADLLKRTKPDVKVLYHRLNRKGQYPVTISREQMQTAFTSYGELEKMMNSIITAMYSGDTFDEFILMKNLFADAILDGKMKTVSTPHIASTGGTTAFLEAVTDASSSFEFPSSNWNTYYENRPSADKGKPIVTWTPTEDQILIVRADVMNKVKIRELAQAFNIDELKFSAQHVKIDSFGKATNVLAVLIDKSWVQVYDNLFETSEFHNGKGLYWNYYLNHWQTYGYSLFANAVAFVCDDETISLNNSTLTFSSTATQTLTATVTPSGATVTWISSDPTIATVSSTGVVTPKSDGTCVISAVNGDKVASCTVTVDLP